MTALQDALPFDIGTVALDGTHRIGLVVVDPGVAFTRSGPLSDPDRMAPMIRAVDRTVRELHRSLGDRLRVLVFLDSHHPDIPEPPYPTHGVVGTGEEQIDPDLAWLLDAPYVTCIRKDCINGFVGAIDRRTGANAFVDWVIREGVGELIVTGDCTDICVSDFVVTALSARNHGLFTPIDPDVDRAAYAAAVRGFRITALAPACATFDAPGHDAVVTHHVGLWLMASRGAVIADGWTV